MMTENCKKRLLKDRDAYVGSKTLAVSDIKVQQREISEDYAGFLDGICTICNETERELSVCLYIVNLVN
jgi:hypothetical protein